MKKTTTNPAPKIGSRDRWLKVGMIGAALALAVSVTPLLGTSADAALSQDGKFCLQAQSDQGEFIGNHGSCDGIPNWSASSLRATATVTLGSGPQVATLFASGLDQQVESYEWIATPTDGGVSVVIGRGRSVQLGQQVKDPGQYRVSVQARMGSKLSRPAVVGGVFNMKKFGQLNGWTLAR